MVCILSTKFSGFSRCYVSVLCTLFSVHCSWETVYEDLVLQTICSHGSVFSKPMFSVPCVQKDSCSDGLIFQHASFPGYQFPRSCSRMFCFCGSMLPGSMYSELYLLRFHVLRVLCSGGYILVVVCSQVLCFCQSTLLSGPYAWGSLWMFSAYWVPCSQGPILSGHFVFSVLEAACLQVFCGF